MARYSSYGNLDNRIQEDLDQGFTGFNNKLRPDQLRPGILTESNNGRMDLNGEWQPRKGIELFSSPFTAGVFTLPFYLYESIPAVSSYSRSGDVITVDFGSAHGIVDGTGVNISGLSYSGLISPNGNFIATVVDTDTITYTVTGLDSTPTGTMTVTGMKLDATAGNFIEASCEFSDPNNDSESYVACVATNSTVLVKTADSGATTETLTYPAGETVPEGSTVIQAFNKLYIFRKGDIALEWDGDISSPTFSLVQNGDYTQPVRLGDGGNNTVISDGVVTVTATAHGLSVGEEVVVTESSDQLVVGDSYTIASVPDADTFTFYAQYDDESSHNNHYSKKTSQGLGFTHMPAPEFGVYHQRRLIVPYQYDVTGSSGSATITDRNIVDEALFSDILDADTYDRIYGQFRFNAGAADFIVGFHSFSDDKLVVFNRNSVHIVANSLDLGSSVSQLITNEVGCLARDSIQQIGNSMIFLSDNGVYGLDFIDLYNLRGQDVPLSASIEGTIKRINKEYASKAKSVYFNNRYYLAVPLDSSTTNNALLIYNFLNKQWESIDSINDPEWQYSELTVAGEGDKRSVYAINRNGGVHQYESRSDDRDRYIVQVGGTITDNQLESSVITRMFNLNSLDRKKWNNFDLHIQSSENNTSDGDLQAITENIDDIIDLGSISDLNGSDLAIDEDVSLRGRFGNRRAYGLQFKLTITKGRPRLRALKVAGATSFRSLDKAE
tara:strand:+ start:691 stop:2862 length:2172 start_codon:yes stop_codon:yes gene_type:complete